MKTEKTKAGHYNFRNELGYVVLTWYPYAKVARHRVYFVDANDIQEASRIAQSYGNFVPHRD